MRAIPALAYMVISLTQAAEADQGLSVATSESPLVVELSVQAPPPDQTLYLHLAIAMMQTEARHPPRVRLVLDPSREIWKAVCVEDRVIGILSIFPWPPRGKDPIRASFNLTQALERLAATLGVEVDTLYGRLPISVDVLPDSRDRRPVGIRVHGLAVSQSGQIPNTGH